AVAALTARTADRFVVREGTVGHSSQNGVQIVERAAIGIATVAAGATHPTDGLVPGECAVSNHQGGVPPVPEGAASPVPAADAGRARTTDGLIVAEGAVGNYQCCPGEAVGDGAPLTCGTADGGNGQPAPTHHQIVPEGTVVHGHRAAFVEDGATTGALSRCPEGLVVGEVDMRPSQAAAGIVDAPTPGFCPGNTEGLVLGHYDMGQAQVAAGVPNAATPVGPPVGDRQAVDGHGHGTVDSEDTAAVVGADGQPAGARAV